MTAVQIRCPAGDHEVFVPAAFAGAIGQQTKFAGQPATLVAAEVVENGAAVLLTFDVDGPVPGVQTDGGAFSAASEPTEPRWWCVGCGAPKTGPSPRERCETCGHSSATNTRPGT